MKYLDEHVPLYHAFVPPQKTWQDKFREEFGIHFSDSELQFVIAFIEDTITEHEAEARREERQFILNILDGIDIADGECTTKAIRQCLEARYVQ